MSDEPVKFSTVPPKAWYTSRTVVASLVAVLLALFGGLLRAKGVEVNQEALVDAILATIGAAAGLVALYGRIKASRPIYWRKRAIPVEPSVGSDDPQRTSLKPTAKKVAQNPNHSSSPSK